MEEMGTALIGKMPWWYVCFMLPFVAGFFALHLRRNKARKFYWHSFSLERQKNVIKKMFMAMETKLVDKQILENRLCEIEKQIQLNTLELKENSTELLRQTFYLPKTSTPIGVRLEAGLKFIKEGGNSTCRDNVLTAVKEKPDVYEYIIAVHPELAIK